MIFSETEQKGRVTVAVDEKRNINEEFGNRLKEIIENRKRETGKNLRVMAKDLDVSLGVLSDWQNGNKTPRGDSIAKLANYFGVSADYLLGLTDAQTTDTDLRAVADYTGLSENAILALRDPEMFELYDKSQKKLLSDMIADENCLHHIVNNIHLYLKATEEQVQEAEELMKQGELIDLRDADSPEMELCLFRASRTVESYMKYLKHEKLKELYIMVDLEDL